MRLSQPAAWPVVTVFVFSRKRKSEEVGGGESAGAGKKRKVCPPLRPVHIYQTNVLCVYTPIQEKVSSGWEHS